MTEKTDAWINLVQFFESIVGKSQFARDTDLHADLDLEPEKIQSILSEWALKFNVDMSEFDLAHYYPASELTLKGLFSTLLKAPFSQDARETLGGWQLTLGMLEQAMISGKWEDENKVC